MNEQSVVFGVERNTSQRPLGRDPRKQLRDYGNHLISVALLKDWRGFARREPRAACVRVL